MTALFRRLFTQTQPVQPGIYTYQSPPQDVRNYKLHLRVEEDGSGVMIVNASTVLHLNQTATEYAYAFIQNQPADQVARQMSRRYHVESSKAEEDYHNLAERILTLIEVPDLDPVTFLDFERKTPYAHKITAPYRLDCAITYQLRADADPSTAPLKRVDRELTTEEWKTILDKAWKAGIPHVIFTGGEPTLRDDLPALISRAESNGQVSGLLTDGLRLADEVYLNQLLQTGLDHLMVVFQPDQETSWEALYKALAADIFVAVHLTVTPGNAADLPTHLEKLAQKGVLAVSLSAQDASLSANLQSLRDQAASLGLSLVWDLPVPYSTQNPVTLEVSGEGPVEGAGRAWLYVEPDGDVLPAQGVNQVLGNMLRDPWSKIWGK
jgi:organic radical activating enzyme